MDEAGVQYIGFVFIAPIPIWNNGKPLVLQREAEHRRAMVASRRPSSVQSPRCGRPSPSGTVQPSS